MYKENSCHEIHENFSQIPVVEPLRICKLPSLIHQASTAHSGHAPLNWAPRVGEFAHLITLGLQTIVVLTMEVS
jgi:hypothetical protein